MVLEARCWVKCSLLSLGFRATIGAASNCCAYREVTIWNHATSLSRCSKSIDAINRGNDTNDYRDTQQLIIKKTSKSAVATEKDGPHSKQQLNQGKSRLCSGILHSRTGLQKVCRRI